MEIILKQDVAKLGNADDLVTVKSGYGRNYLIPQGMAIMATESNKKQLEETNRQRAFKFEKMKKAAEDVGTRLEKVEITIGAKVGETGKIYGSVTTIQLAEALQAKGFEVDRKMITFEDDHIKTLGTYAATINLHRDHKVRIEFEVVAE